MKREYLKSTGGCDRCKLRRKKCDEQRPLCGSCIRLKLICTWTSSTRKRGSGQTPSRATVATENQQALTIQRVPCFLHNSLGSYHLLNHGYQPFRDQAQFHFSTRIADVYAPLIAKSAYQATKDTSILTRMALQNEVTRDAMAGFSAYVSYSVDSVNIKLREQALCLYQRGMTTLSKTLCIRQSDADMIAMLVTITFLGLLESLGTGDFEAARVHFLAAARTCQGCRPRLSWSSTQLSLYRVVVECWLFNLASTAIFYKHCQDIIKMIDWSILYDTFNSSKLDASSYPHSPHFGGNHAIYRLMLQSACLARATHSHTHQKFQISAWEAELNDLEESLSIYFQQLPRTVAELYHSKYLLHIWALRIVFEKISNRSTTGKTPKVRTIVSDAQRLLSSKDMHEQRNPSLAWPLIIFLLASSQESSFEFFAASDIYTNFDVGHRKRFDEVKKRLGWCKRNNVDGLDLLSLESGILSVSDE